MRLRLRTFTSLVMALAVGLFAWSTLVEPRRLVVRHEELALPRWPVELRGIRIALLSDLHVGSPHWGLQRLPELVRRTNAEHADLVLLAGDYISHVDFGEHVDPEAIADALADLRAPLGVLLVLGNHDMWFNGPRVAAAFGHTGLRVLSDELEVVRFHGRELYIVGLADQVTRPRRAAQTLAQLPVGATAIVLVHEPDVFDELDDRVALTLAGHTHGGQVDLPWFGPLIVPSSHGADYARGHIVDNGRHLFVTSGIGTSIIPVRFRVPPEIVVLTLR